MPAFGMASPTAVMKYNEDFSEKPVGTGPYVFKSWQDNGEITLEKNLNYWGESPKVSTLVFTVIPENEDRVDLILQEKVQFLENLSLEEIERLEMSEEVSLVKRPFTNIGYMAMNTNNAFLANREVRQAIGTAVKKEMADTGYFNKLNRWTDTFVPPGIWGNNNTIRFNYMSKKETQSVIEKNSPVHVKLRLLIMKEGRPYFPNPMKVAVQIQSALDAYGIEVEIVEETWEVFLNSIQEEEYDLLLMGWMADVMDPDNFLYTFFSSENTAEGVVSNYAHYENRIVDQLLTMARQATDHAFRESLYRKLQEIISYDVPAVPIANTITIVAVDRNIQNYKPMMTGLEPLNEVNYERIQQYEE